MKPRVLIVGTVPYNAKSTSRAFESYFSEWEKENLAQIFSHTKKPAKGHCGKLFQITDKRILHRWINSKIQTGVSFSYEELPDEWGDNSLEVGSGFVRKLYQLGSHRTPFTHLLRKVLWQKRFWCTDQLIEWMDSFAPQCVFLAFSDDFFIPEIALFAAKRYNIPIVSCIGDDYYFNDRFSISPFYHIYKRSYRKIIDKIFAHPGSAIYIGDKIRDKYNEAFDLQGETVYVTSKVQRKEFAAINTYAPLICYFGNIGAGRNNSLCDIGESLAKINSEYRLHVYSNETDKRLIQVLEKQNNIVFHGSIPYAEVQKKNRESDIVVLVEGFSKKDINKTRYSLSTKAADSLASGSNILVYGSSECGLIEYMAGTDSAAVCTRCELLEETIRKLVFDVEYQRSNYNNAIHIYNKNHILEKSTAVFESVIRRVIEEKENGYRR